MEEYGVELEVYEKAEEFKDYLKKKKVFLILFILILIASAIIIFPRTPFKIGFKTKESIIATVCLILGSLIYSIVLTLITYKIFIKIYNHWFNKVPKYHQYLIKLYSDYILINRPDALKFEYYEVKVSSSKNCYFIEYKRNRKINEVCLINKTYCPEKAQEILEKLLKK